MTDWNETTLRAAASWKAFKDGKSLFEIGAVTGMKIGGDSWSGSVKDGKRVFKAGVKMISPTNLETRCACPENQSTGALCAHGVAAGLAALGNPGLKAAPAAAPASAAVAHAFSISLPVNWMESFKRGRLSATLTPAKETSLADERIGEWLASIGQLVKFPLLMNLDGEGSGRFLASLTDHPRVTVGKTGEPVEIREGGRIVVDCAERSESFVLLSIAEEPVFRMGADWWRLSSAGVSKIGAGSVPLVLSGWLNRLLAERSVRIPLTDFLGNLALVQEWLEFPEDSWLDGIHFVPARPIFQLAIDGSLQRLEATLRVQYGTGPSVVVGQGQMNGLPMLIGDRCEVRDWEAEKAAVRLLEKSAFQSIVLGSGKWVLNNESSVIEFLSRELSALKNEWNVVESDRFKQSMKQFSIVAPRIEILGSGDDWLSFNLTFQTSDGSVVPMGEIRRLLAAGRSGSGKKIAISDNVSNIIEPLFEDLELKQEGGHFIASKRSGEVIREIRKKLHNINLDNDLDVRLVQFDRGLIQAELRPYQIVGAEWLLDRSERFGGALLADDMGLGKTIQTIACIEHLIRGSTDSSGMILVIATASLLGNWKAEFKKFAPDRPVRILHGSSREKQQQLATGGEVLLTTFGTLPRDLAWYLKQSFRAVIVDEASLMRNPDTDHAKAISRLKADVRIALTGTPIENGLRDLWSIFRFIQPGWLGSREDFKGRYDEVSGESRTMERLRLKTSPFLLRRTKEEVAPELPSKIHIEEFCDLSAEQQSVYRDLLVEGRKKVEVLQDSKNSGAARMQVLTALLRLRQTCCDLVLLGNDRFNQMSVSKRSGKLMRLLELIDEAVGGNHRMLIFSQFSTQLREIEKCLLEAGIDCLKLDGQTRKRQEMVDRFQGPDGPPVFLISLKAGGYGLNLTAADIVVHFDPWWNPAAEAQATDRAHRIGQTRPVTVYRLITRGTVEEKVVSLQNKKRLIAAAVDETGSGDAAGWSESELMGLMEG